MKVISALIYFIILTQPVLLQAQEIDWIRNFEEGKRKAFAQNKLIIIYFENSSSEQSFRMNNETWNQSSVIDLAGNFICVKVDNEGLSRSHNLMLRDKAQKLSVRYRIQYTPTTVVIDALGNELTRVVGYTPAKDFRERLKMLPLNVEPLYSVLARLEKNPDSVQLKIETGDAYRHLKQPVMSNRYYEEVVDADTLKKDKNLAKQVAVYRALNYYEMKKLKESIEQFENILDAYPGSSDRPFQLYMLTKLYLESLNEVRANDYRTMLEKEYPGSEYTALAQALFGK